MIYICGDSFNTSDNSYPTLSWVDRFIINNNNTTNLSMVCASNLLISLQVNRAIEQNAKFIIVSFTSATRSEVQYNDSKAVDLLDRFYNITSNNNTNSNLVSYTIWNTKSAIPLTSDQQQSLINYNKEFFDLDLAIYRDKIIIEHTLEKLVNSNIKFIFDQGGFEHPSFNTKLTYFEKYDQFRSKYNIWDYAKERTFRPYFHITDEKITTMISDYYTNIIKD